MAIPVDQVRSRCERHSLIAPADDVLFEGFKDRLADIDRPDEDDGYLSLFPDGAGGFIQNHRRGDFPKGEVFFFDGMKPGQMTEEQRRAAKHARKAAKELENSKHWMAAADCTAIWRESQPADPNHPYLVKKHCSWLAASLRQISQPPSQLLNWRKMRGQVTFPLLLIPGFAAADGKLQALEYIDADGEKLFHPGAKQQGAVFFVGWRDDAQQILLAEGISTGASLHEAMRMPVAVTFSAGNLPEVAKWSAARFPGVRLCVCADDDDDRRVDLRNGRAIPNKGLIKGREAAAAVGAWMATPGTPGTDFNDLYLAHGAGAIQARLQAAEIPRGKAPAPASAPPPDIQAVLQATSVSEGERIIWEQCWGVLDQAMIYHVPSGRFLQMGVVDKAMGFNPFGRSKASDALMSERAVSSAVWSPGDPIIIVDKRLKDDVAWVDEKGARQLNLYRPPLRSNGDAAQAKRWLDHLERLWPDDFHHLILWFAHRRQRPAEKINHALVLGGAQGCGKDTALEPVKYAVGAWNFRETSPREIITPPFNPYIKSVILRVSEARDMGENDRYKFYEQMKTLCAAPPDVLMMNDKHMRTVAVLNVCGVIYTTNHKVHGMHLAADDRRHFVAWSDVTKEEFEPEYFTELYAWMTLGGGMAHAAAYLDQVDISRWDCKAPPPKTNAFWEMILADTPQESGDMAEVLRQMGNPEAVTIEGLRTVSQAMGPSKAEFCEWAWGKDANRHRRALVHRLEEAGYGATANQVAADGRWWIGSTNVTIYTLRKLPGAARYRAAQAIQSRPAAAGNIVSIFGT